MKAMMIELGCKPELDVVRIHADSAVARSFVATRGPGGMRHLDVQLRWLQECVQQGRLLVIKVSGATSVADAMTKYHDVLALKTLLVPHGIEVAPAAGGGRAEGGVGRSAPKRAQITSCTVPLLCIGGVACCGFAVPHTTRPAAFGASIIVVLRLVSRKVVATQGRTSIT